MTQQIEIVREDRDTGGALVIRDDLGDLLAKMTFTNISSKQRSVDHTEVSEALKGRGAGQALAKRMVEEGRKDGVTLIPICPFFLATARTHPEWHDAVRMPNVADHKKEH